jgi:hypothetical protein
LVRGACHPNSDFSRQPFGCFRDGGQVISESVAPAVRLQMGEEYCGLFACKIVDFL